jgi:hypothetical protein
MSTLVGDDGRRWIIIVIVSAGNHASEMVLRSFEQLDTVAIGARCISSFCERVSQVRY